MFNHPTLENKQFHSRVTTPAYISIQHGRQGSLSFPWAFLSPAISHRIKGCYHMQRFGFCDFHITNKAWIGCTFLRSEDSTTIHPNVNLLQNLLLQSKTEVWFPCLLTLPVQRDALLPDYFFPLHQEDPCSPEAHSVWHGYGGWSSCPGFSYHACESSLGLSIICSCHSALGHTTLGL